MKGLSEKVVAGGFTLALSLLCGVGVESYFSVNRLVEGRRWVDHTHYVLDTLNQIPEGMEEADRGRRGYFVLKSDKGLNVLRAGVQKTKQAVVEVRQLTSDNAEQQHRLAEIEPFIVQRLTLFEHFVDLVRQNKLKPTDRDATLRQNLFLQQRIQLGLQAMEQTERTLLQQRSDAIDRAVQQSLVASGIGYSLSFCLLTGIFFLLQREVRSRKQAEVALQNYVEEVSDLYNHAPCGYHSLDVAGTFIRINETELEWLGYTRSEVLHKKTFIELTTAQSALKFQESFPKFKEQGWINDLEFELVRKDGTTLPVSLSATAIQDAEGNFVMSRSTLFNISDRKRAQVALQHANEQLEARVQARTAELSQVNALLHSELIDRKLAEQALAESEKQLRLITDALPVLISYIDADQCYRFNNQAYEQWSGRKRAEITGQSLRHVLGETAYQLIQPHVEAALSGQTITYESKIPYGNGTRWIDATYIPDFGEQGNVKGLFALVTDITDRKLVEESLRESKERLAFALQTAEMGDWELNLDDRTATRSFRHDQIFGYDCLQNEWTYEQFLSHVLPDDRATVKANFGTALVKAEIWDFECRIRRLDGALRWIWGRGHLYHDAQGDTVRMLGLIADITHRKQVEEALRESEQRLSLAIEGSGMATWDINLKTGQALWSAQHFTLLGYEPVPSGEATLSMWQRCIHPEDAEGVVEAAAQAIQTRSLYRLEHRIQRADNGQTVWLAAFGRVLYDEAGQAVRFIGIILDISDRKCAEAALRESEQRLSLAIEGSGMATWDINLQTGAALWSAQHFTLLGYEPVPSGEATLSMWQHCVHPDDVEAVMQSAERAMQTRSLYRSEYRIRRVDNEQIVWLAVFGRGVYDKTGQAVRFIGIILDISDRKQAELALQQAKDGLEIQVQERTAALKQSNDDLQRSNQELEQFAYVASHDLQEPLRAIMGYTQLLTQDYRDRLDETAQGYGAYIVEGAQRMQQLIQDLLHYSRAGTRDLDFAPTDCNKVLEQVLSNLQVAIAERNATITSDPLPTVIADKSQLAQLFQNLVGNAIKFCREESSQVHISARRVEEQGKQGKQEGQEKTPIYTPHPTPHTPHSAWLFSIHDNGIGIKPRYLERIFEIFKRLHTRTEFPGTGIGLAICKKIVDRHNGRIWAESEPGNGTTFYFTIPYDDDSDAQLNRDFAGGRFS